jgi:heme-degrading monooxygenase HmoA
MDLPWSAAPAPSDGFEGRDAYVMASRFELTSGWRSPAFLVQAVRVWRQARRSPGLIGVSLRAQPLRRTYWTLSAWTGEAALREYARTEPHRTVMRRVRPWARTATFRFWTVPAQELAAGAAAGRLWADAEHRISAADPAQGERE